MTRRSVTHLVMETRGSTWCGISGESALWRCAPHAWGYVSSTQIRSSVSGKETAQYGLAKGPKTSQVLDQVSLAPWQRLPAPSFCQRARVIFCLKDPLCVLGTLHSDATTTRPMRRMTYVNLYENKIGDRGAVALAGAIQALLVTVFSGRPHTLFLRFGLDNLLPVTLSRPFDVLENRAFVTRKKCKLCSVRAERARNLLSGTLVRAGVLCTVGGQCFRLLLHQMKQQM